MFLQIGTNHCIRICIFINLLQNIVQYLIYINSILLFKSESIDFLNIKLKLFPIFWSKNRSSLLWIPVFWLWKKSNFCLTNKFFFSILDMKSKFESQVKSPESQILFLYVIRIGFEKRKNISLESKPNLTLNRKFCFDYFFQV